MKDIRSLTKRVCAGSLAAIMVATSGYVPGSTVQVKAADTSVQDVEDNGQESTDIPTTESEEKKHEHGSWNYLVEKNVIKATCGVEGCTENYSETLTLNPEVMTYTGDPYKVEYKIKDNKEDTVNKEDSKAFSGKDISYNYSGTLCNGTKYQSTDTPPKDAGTYTVKLIVGNGNGETDCTAEAEFEINKKKVYLPTAAEVTYDGSEQNLLKGDADNLKLFDFYSQSGEQYVNNEPKETDAGEYFVTCKLKEEYKNNYVINSEEDWVSCTINKKEIASPTAAANLTYDGSKQNLLDVDVAKLNEEQKGKLLFSFDNGITWRNWENTRKTNAGTYTIIYEVNPEYSSNYYVKGSALQATIKKGTLQESENFTITGKDCTYTGEEQPLISVSGNQIKESLKYSVNGSEYSESIPTGKNAGKYYISYRIKGMNNYEDVEGHLTVEIAKKTVKLPVIDSKEYNGGPQIATIKDDKELLYQALNNEERTEVGTYKIILALKDWNNYKWEGTDEPFVKVNFEITPKNLQLHVPKQVVTYGEKPKYEYAYNDNSEKLCEGDSLNVSYTVKKNDVEITDAEKLDAGKYTIEAEAKNPNYEINITSGILTVNTKKLDITPSANQSKTYGEADPELKYDVKGMVYNDQISDLSLSGSLAREEGDKAGTYKITKGDLECGNPNYTLNDNVKDAVFTINPASLNIKDCNAKLSSESYIYDGKTKTPTVKVIYKGKTLEPNDDYKVSYNKNTNAGKASVVIKGQRNYKDTISKTFVIGPKAIANKIYTNKTLKASDYAGAGAKFVNVDKKYFVISKDGKTIKTKSPEKYAKVNLAKKTFTVTLQDQQGEKYPYKKIKIAIPAPRKKDVVVKVSPNGKEYKRYLFRYNFKYADKVLVTIQNIGQSKALTPKGIRIVNKMLQKRVSQKKCTKKSSISLHKDDVKNIKNKSEFVFKVKYGKNVSEALYITIK